MKRIKQIIEALRVFHEKPIEEIKGAWNRISDGIEKAVLEQRVNDDDINPNDWKIISSVVRAFVGAAEDMEKPAKDEVKA